MYVYTCSTDARNNFKYKPGSMRKGETSIMQFISKNHNLINYLAYT